MCVKPISYQKGQYEWGQRARENSDFDIFQFGILGHSEDKIPMLENKIRKENDALVEGLDDSEYRHDDVNSTVTLLPKLIQLLHGSVDVSFYAGSNSGLDDDGMGLVANFENIVPRNKSKAGMG
jgi:hypothetical protein